MSTLMPQKDLAELYGRITREITPQATGVQLHPDTADPAGEIYTVYITFEKGFHIAFSLCAERALFTRAAQFMMQTEEISQQDIEDVAKEYINVLCGHFASQLFQLTKIPARFSVPAFQAGRRTLEGHREDIVLTYSGDQGEHIQLTLHIPLGDAQDGCA